MGDEILSCLHGSLCKKEKADIAECVPGVHDSEGWVLFPLIHGHEGVDRASEGNE